MRIAAFNQFFWPDQAPTSQLLTDLTRRLAASGHDVTVVCGAPGYLEAKPTDKPLVRIQPTSTLRFSRGTLARLSSYLSYFAGATWRAVRLGKVDVVITMTTPPYLSLVGNLMKRLRGTQHVVWEMDVYPEVAVDTGAIRKGSLLERVLGAVAHRSRNYADCVWVLGDCMQRRIVATGCDARRIEVHENWAPDSLYRGPVDAQPNRLRAIYSGNLGRSHDISTLRGALRALRADERIVVRMAGGGSERQPLEAFVRAEGLSNIEFLPYVPHERLGDVLSDADVGLVTLRDGCQGVVVPSKVYGLMACGRPIVFVGPADSTPARVIRRFDCGWQVECGDVRGLVDCLTRLASDPASVRDAGSRARAAFLEHYERDRAVERLCQAITRA